MKPNMGTTDKAIRLTVAAIIIVALLTGQVGGTLAIVLGVVAAAFIVTSLISWCPSYVPFGLSTRKKE